MKPKLPVGSENENYTLKINRIEEEIKKITLTVSAQLTRLKSKNYGNRGGNSPKGRYNLAKMLTHIMELESYIIDKNDKKQFQAIVRRCNLNQHVSYQTINRFNSQENSPEQNKKPEFMRRNTFKIDDQKLERRNTIRIEPKLERRNTIKVDDKLKDGLIENKFGSAKKKKSPRHLSDTKEKDT